MRKLLPITFLFAVSASAQTSGRIVSATLDRDSILIGQQAVLVLELDADGLPVAWPVIGDTLAEQVELVRDGGIDTLTADGPAGQRILRRLVITSTSSVWPLPSTPAIPSTSPA